MDHVHDDDLEDDETALEMRRANLRAFIDEVADAVAALPLPETFLEGERAVRYITIADRLIVNLPYEGEIPPFPKRYLAPRRRTLRTCADRVMEAVTRLDKPTCYLEGERAGRYALAADRMLTQLYAPPKPAKDFGGDGDGYDPNDILTWSIEGRHDDIEFWRERLKAQINALDGRPWDRDKSQADACAEGSAPSGSQDSLPDGSDHNDMIPPDVSLTEGGSIAPPPVPADTGPRIRSFDAPYRPAKFPP